MGKTSMIDALELKIPDGIHFRPPWRFLENISSSHASSSLVTAGYQRCDLRRYGLNGILHTRNDRGTKYQKFAFVRTSTLAHSTMLSVLAALFECDISIFPIARIDFAVDLAGTPISWFRERLVASRKRFSSEFGRCGGSGAVQVETLYLGKRPNCFRVYDKILEQYRDPNIPPNLESVTRVERQCGGQGVPGCLRTFGQLANAADFNPFAPLRTLSVLTPLMDLPAGNATVVLARIGFETLTKRLGAQGATHFINMISSGNAARTRRRIGVYDFRTREQLPDLLRIYRKTISQQLEIGSSGENDLG